MWVFSDQPLVVLGIRQNTVKRALVSGINRRRLLAAGREGVSGFSQGIVHQEADNGGEILSADHLKLQILNEGLNFHFFNRFLCCVVFLG